MNEVILDFLSTEINDQECYDNIYNFIVDQNIRSGEYEGNIYVIKKYDRLNFIIFQEFQYQNDGHKEIYKAISFFRKDILKMINEYAKNQGYNVKDYGKESNDVITSW